MGFCFGITQAAPVANKGGGAACFFRFPLQGGTGAIWKGVIRLLPKDKQVRSLGT